MPTPTIIPNSNTNNNYFAMLSSEGDKKEDDDVTIKISNKATTPSAKLPMKDNNRPQDQTTQIAPIIINASTLCKRTAIINTGYT